MAKKKVNEGTPDEFGFISDDDFGFVEDAPAPLKDSGAARFNHFIGPNNPHKDPPKPVAARQGDRGRNDQSAVGVDHTELANNITDWVVRNVPENWQKTAVWVGGFAGDFGASLLEGAADPEGVALGVLGKGARAVKAASKANVLKRLAGYMSEEIPEPPRRIKGLLPPHVGFTVDADGRTVQTPSGPANITQVVDQAAVNANTPTNILDRLQPIQAEAGPVIHNTDAQIPRTLDRMGVNPPENLPYPLNVVPRSLHPTNEMFQRNVPAAIQDRIGAKGVELRPLEPPTGKTVILSDEGITPRESVPYTPYETPSATRLPREKPPVVVETKPPTEAEIIQQKLQSVKDKAKAVSQTSKSDTVTLANPDADQIEMLTQNGYQLVSRNSKTSTFKRIVQQLKNEKGAIGDQSGPKTLGELQEQNQTGLRGAIDKLKNFDFNNETGRAERVAEWRKDNGIDLDAIKREAEAETAQVSGRKNPYTPEEREILQERKGIRRQLTSLFDSLPGRAELKKSNFSEYNQQKIKFFEQKGFYENGNIAPQHMLSRELNFKDYLTGSPRLKKLFNDERGAIGDLKNDPNFQASSRLKALGRNKSKTGDTLLQTGERVEFDPKTPRVFLFNPETDEMLWGGTSDLHAIAAHNAGLTPERFDKFNVHGRVNSDGSVGYYRAKGLAQGDPAAATDINYKLISKLMDIGVPKDTKIVYRGGQRTLGESLNRVFTDESGAIDIGGFLGKLPRILGFNKSEVIDLRKQILDDLVSQPELDLESTFQKFKDKLDRNKFWRITGDAQFEADYKRALDTRPAPVQPLADPGVQGAMRTILDNVKENIVARNEQDVAVRAEKLRRINNVRAIRSSGMDAMFDRLKELRGKYPKITPNEINESIDPGLVDQIQDQIWNSPWTNDHFEKLNTQIALSKVLGKIKSEGALQPNEIEKLTRFFGKEIADDLVEMHGAMGGIPIENSKLLEAAQIAKTVTSAGDIGWPLRQGINYAGRESWRKAIWPSVKSYFSASFADKELDAIRQHKYYKLAEDSKLALSDYKAMDAGLREESNPSKFFETIEKHGGLRKALVTPVTGSNRAMTVGLDRLRFGEFVKKIEAYQKIYQGELADAIKSGDQFRIKNAEMINPEQPFNLERIADEINTATGRGSLGKLESSGKTLNALMFSPRLLASRLRSINRILNPYKYTTYDKIQRQDALKQLLSIGTIMGSTLLSGKLMGGETTGNVTSTDFLKSKFGNLRIEGSGGYIPLIVNAMRLATGATTDADGDMHRLGDFGVRSGVQVLEDVALNNRLSPAGAFVAALLNREEFGGKPLDSNTPIRTMFTPIILQDLYEIAQSDPNLVQGLIKAGAVGVPAMMGVGTQVYSKGDREKKPKLQLQKIGPLSYPSNGTKANLGPLGLQDLQENGK